MSLDGYLYDLSHLFLLPVQLGVALLFLYSIFALGMFAMLRIQRWLARKRLGVMSSLDLVLTA